MEEIKYICMEDRITNIESRTDAYWVQESLRCCIDKYDFVYCKRGKYIKVALDECMFYCNCKLECGLCKTSPLEPTNKCISEWPLSVVLRKFKVFEN